MVTVRRLDHGDIDLVVAAAEIFDLPPSERLTAEFFAAAGHHMVGAVDDGRLIGFASGVEVRHPDKVVEILLYELGVAEFARGHGVGRRLVTAVVDLARSIGARGVWVLTEPDNAAALATYVAAGARTTPPTVLLEWDPL